ncbi:MAG TPA: hypothetical protein VFH31_04350 [Pyrinomonadaceae bacterium]|nr:hypothetical protein [Pyrinomonadaceae bacterium]
MDCCAVDEIENSAIAVEPDEPLVCVRCGGQGKPVSRKTVLSTIKPEFLEAALNGTYTFCHTRECQVVYFEEQGTRVFTVDDLRIIVGVKASTDPIPLCYCFGFDERHLRAEIAQMGSTTVPERISRLIREGLCACDVRNPAGNCCLGEVNRTAKRLKNKAVQQV